MDALNKHIQEISLAADKLEHLIDFFSQQDHDLDISDAKINFDRKSGYILNCISFEEIGMNVIPTKEEDLTFFVEINNNPLGVFSDQETYNLLGARYNAVFSYLTETEKKGLTPIEKVTCNDVVSLDSSLEVNRAVLQNKIDSL